MAVLVLSACTVAPNADKENVKQEQEKEKAKTVEKEESEDDQDLSFFELTMPDYYFQDVSSDEVIADFKEQGIDDVTANDDGSYTLRIPTEKHEEMLKELRGNFEIALHETIGAMNVEAIKDVVLNDSVTEMTVTIDRELNGGDLKGLVLIDFAILAMDYQIMNGVTTEEDFDFQVVLVDEKTGEVFDTISIHDED